MAQAISKGQISFQLSLTLLVYVFDEKLDSFWSHRSLIHFCEIMWHAASCYMILCFNYWCTVITTFVASEDVELMILILDDVVLWNEFLNQYSNHRAKCILMINVSIIRWTSNQIEESCIINLIEFDHLSYFGKYFFIVLKPYSKYHNILNVQQCNLHESFDSRK